VRFRNDQSEPIRVYEIGRTVAPGEEFDWPGWDRDEHGPIPGCALLDDEPDGGGESDGDDPGGTAGSTPAPSPGKPAPAATTPPAAGSGPGAQPPKASTPAQAAASEEN
jgi:hypothetical protein